jgi:ferrochelatase
VRGGSLGYDLVFQSRSGPPSVPWLEPDVNDHLTALAKGPASALPGEPPAAGRAANGGALPPGPPPAVVLVPVGFVSDHMEVVHDLDVEAAATAASLGLEFARAAAPGGTPRFAAMVRQLVAELDGGGPALALGGLGPRGYPDGAFADGGHACPADCCRYAPARPGPGGAGNGRPA